MLSRRIWIELARIALTVVLLASGLASRADTALSSTVDEPSNREIILVFDPRGNPPRAYDIVYGNPADTRIPSYLTLFGQTQSMRQWYPFQLLTTEAASALRATNPIAPELLVDQVIIVRYPPGTDMGAQLQRITADGRVLAAVRNFPLDLAVTPNDPFFAVNGGTPTTAVQGKYQWGWSLLRFPQAWDKIRGAAYVADIDNGVYWQNGATHPDLQANLRPHFSSWISDQPVGGSSSVYYLNPNIDEPTAAPPAPTFKGHGTHTAGLIAATPNNALGVAGGCWNCSLIEIGVGGDGAAVAAALTEALRRGAQVVNMSFASTPIGQTTPYISPSFCTGANSTIPPCNAIAIARSREVVLVASSGNDKYQVQFPANQDGVMAIGGLEFVDQTPTATFWVHGYKPLDHPGVQNPPNDCANTTEPNPLLDDTGSNCGSTQFLVAPAKDVLSTFYFGFNWNTDVHCADRADPGVQGVPGSGWTGYLPTGYGDCTGTSMSAPHVSALAGLMRSANPLLTVPDIRRLMQRDASGNDTRISDYMGFGYPIADNAVISVLSGATGVNPNLFDPNVKNRLTPLFSLYSSQGRNHFYSIAPQMAVSAYNGTLIPSPRYKANSATYSASCASFCSLDTPGVITPPIAIVNPNGSAAGSNIGVHVAEVQGNTSPTETFSITNTGGTVSTGMTFSVGGGSATLTVTPFTDYPLPYSIVGNLIPGNYLFPSITTAARSSVSVYVSHVNPLGSGPDLIPIYRFSWRCGDYPYGLCDNSGLSNYNPFHISHAYTTDSQEVSNFQTVGYKLDGIEGYVFPKSYSNAPQTGMVRLCRLYDPNADEEILFPGTGSGGKNCYPPFPSYTPGSYYSTTVGTTNWLGWVYPNYNGGTPPTVSITSPANNSSFSAGATVTLKASAAGSVTSVSYYANGVFLGTKTTSPYQKNWQNVAAGVYTIYAVALQSSTGLTTTSAPITITVGAPPPTFANSGFETPFLGAGNYEYAPTGGSWTFVPGTLYGGSGIAGNGSAFTFQNQNAPEALQVGFIQGGQTIAQTVNFTATGTYHVQFYAAQRVGNGTYLQLQLLVDGVNVGTQFPASGATSYAIYSSNSFNITTTGSHTITFLGVNDGNDNTIFFDLVTIASP